MIQHIKHKSIDLAKWDALISDCGLVYAQSWYLDIVHPDWSALVLDDYEAVMPITGRKKFGVNYLFQPFFVQQLGVFSRRKVTAEMLQDFLNAIPKKFRFAEIRLNEGNVVENQLQGIEYHRNVVLDLNQDYDTIRANYHTNTKRNLAKAENLGLQVVENVELQQIVRLFRENRGATVGIWGDAEYATLINLGESAMKRDAAFTLGVTEKDSVQLLCGALFMKTASRVIFLFSGNCDKGKAIQAMTFLMDSVIQHFANQSITFDFEGSDDKDLARFYLGFGGEERWYPGITSNALSPIGKRFLNLWKKRKKK